MRSTYCTVAQVDASAVRNYCNYKLVSTSGFNSLNVESQHERDELSKYNNMPLSTPKYQLARCVKYGLPERSEEEIRKLEKAFVLDCVFVSTLSDDSGRANPKMATAIPPYNGQKDKFAKNYFDCPVVNKVLRKTGQDINQGESLCGKQMDRFYYSGNMGTHIRLRNQNGAGNSQQLVRGHSMFMESPKPIIGYHGLYGFRRNTPWLRQKPSVFIGKVDNRSLVP